MRSVHVPLALPGPVMEALAAEFALVDAVEAADGLVATPVVPVDAGLLERAPRLRVVAQFGVGYDNVDLAAATARGVVVANTPDVLTTATAELTLALLLALVRRVAEGDRLIRRRGDWRLEPTFMLGRGLAGRTLGIVGYGRIGREVGRLAEAHGVRVVKTRETPLEELLRVSDAVTLHVPLGPATEGLIGARELALMRPDAVLVNTARGPVVDEAALVAALRERRIAGAALDVFADEPHVPEALLGLENVVLTPHLGSATEEARNAMGMLCVEALRAVLLEGRTPPHALNPDAVPS